jgi:hypothetical protein
MDNLNLIDLIFVYLALCVLGAKIFILMTVSSPPKNDFYVTQWHLWTLKRRVIHHVSEAIGYTLLLPIFAIAVKILFLATKKL